MTRALWQRTLFVMIFLFSLALQAAPLSDVSIEDFEKGPAALNPSPKSPFLPTSRLGEDLDVGSLVVQGIVYGKPFRMALVSGRIIREGEKLGKYSVEKIEKDRISLSFESSQFQLRLENYVPPANKTGGGGYVVEFRNAPIRDTLSLLAKASNLNVIMPEDLSGRVTLSFDEIELIEALRSVLRVNGYEYAIESQILRIGKPEAFVGGTDLRTQNFHLKYATAKDLVTQVKPLTSDRGSVVADERTNTLTVKDRDPIVANIGNLIASVDRRDEQVAIEARIVDASRSFSRSIGIKWGLSGQKSDVRVRGVGEVGTNSSSGNPVNVNLGTNAPTSGLGLIIGSVTGNNFEAQLTASEQKGDIQILSKPSVTTLNNMPAKIRSGTKIYVKSTSSISVGTAGGTSASGATGGLQEINTGIELTVTPQISIDDYIKMKIDAVESEADFSRTVDGIPAVIDNTASTTVLIKDGETTVIGGLVKQKTTREKKGVPGFQSIPVMGYLFQSRTRTRSDGELMIFITPKIIK